MSIKTERFTLEKFELSYFDMMKNLILSIFKSDREWIRATVRMIFYYISLYFKKYYKN